MSDVFDQLTAELPENQISQPNALQKARQATIPPSGPATGNPIGNMLTAGFESAAGSLGNIGVRAAGAIGLASPDRVQQALHNQVFYPQEGTVSSTLGHLAGNVAPAIASGGTLAPIVMGAQGMESAQEEVEAQRAAGRDISGGQQAANVLGQGVLGAGLGYLAPGGRLGSALFSRLPMNLAARLGTSGVIGAGEMLAANTAGNLITQRTGVDPTRSALEGSGSALLQGGILGVGGRGIHELGEHLTKTPDVFDRVQQEAHAAHEARTEPYNMDRTPAEDVQALNERLAKVERTAKSAGPEEKPVAQPDFEKAQFEAPTEPHPETTKALENFVPVERRTAPTPEAGPEGERRFEEILKGAKFQSPEEAAPNLFQKAAGENAAVEEYGKPPTGPVPSQQVRDLARTYSEKTGLPHGTDTEYKPVDEDRAKQIASDYDAMKHDPTDPKVKASYDALKAEMMDQYEHLKEAGYTFTPFHGDEKAGFVGPYAGHEEVMRDIRDNKHLHVWTGGTLPEDHPLAEKAPPNPDDLPTYNTILRAVHDIFGHAKEGYDFGHQGEENAWKQHVQMFSPEARGSMTTETRGQNSWTEAGPYAAEAKAGSPRFPEQKAGLLPEEHTQIERPGLFKRLATEESGGLHLTAEDITGPGSIVHEEVKPILSRFGDFLKKGVEAFRSVFPVEAMASSEKATGAFRANLAEGRLKIHTIADEFEPARKAFGKMTDDDQLDFQRRMYNVEPQATPELQAIADAMYGHTNDGRKALESLGHDAAANWDEQKFNMLWKKDAAKAEDLVTKINRPGKVEGPASFLKSRTLNDFDEGLQKGLVPKYSNPVEQFMATTAERTRYIAGVKAMGDLVAGGSIKRIPADQSIPEGWSEVPSAAQGPLKGLLREDVQGTAEGTIIAPDPVNRIIRNQVTPSLFSTGFRGSVYRMLQGYNNTATQFLLGLSAYHITKVAKESAMMQTARALSLTARGEGEEAAGALQKVATQAVTNIARGKQIQDQLLGKASATPEEARRNAAMIQGGFSAKSDSTYENKIRDRFKKALDDGGIQGLVRAAVYLPLAANEQVSQEGVFKYVQHSKLAIGADLTEDWLRQNPNATQDQIRLHVGRISDHMDNILGLMERDNLFWNKTARDLATLSTLSVGWNYGSARELAGGIVDLGRGVGSLGKNRKISDIDARRLSYLATITATTALTGAMATYMNTGQGPQHLKDYVFPLSGTKDREGHDIRYNPGLYTSDYYDFLTHPLSTLAAKASPLIHASSDLLKNRDYKNNPIYDSADPNDAFHHQMALDILKHLASSNIPMGVQQAINTVQGGGSSAASPTEQILPWLGVKHAPIAASESEAELAARDLVSGQPSHGTPEHRSDIKKLVNMLRDKDPEANDKIAAAVQAGTITGKDAANIHHRANEPGGLKGLLSNSQLDARTIMSRVFPSMESQEIRDNQFVLRRRVAGANLPNDEKQEYMAKINSAVEEGVK